MNHGFTDDTDNKQLDSIRDIRVICGFPNLKSLFSNLSYIYLNASIFWSISATRA